MNIGDKRVIGNREYTLSTIEEDKWRAYRLADKLRKERYLVRLKRTGFRHYEVWVRNPTQGG